jgi:hypothetical protein
VSLFVLSPEIEDRNAVEADNWATSDLTSVDTPTSRTAGDSARL